MIVSFLQGCSSPISSRYELLPSASYIKLNPPTGKLPLDNYESAKSSNKDLERISADTNQSSNIPDNKLSAIKIDVFKSGLKPKLPSINFAYITAWSSTNINLDNLDIRVTNIAKMLGAEYVILLDRESEVTGSMTNYYSTTSASYNTYTVSRKALAGVYSKVYAGFFVEKDGIISFIQPDSPADKAGLREGNKILSINGVYFLQDPYVLYREISIKNIGDNIMIDYLDKNNDKKKTSLKLIGTENISQ